MATVRSIKTVKFTPQQFDKMDQAVNESCMELKNQGHSVVCITPTVVNTMPPCLIYTIVYE